MTHEQDPSPEQRRPAPAGHAADGRPACPSWCEDRDRDDHLCRGDHRGKAWGTIASAGLPPVVDSVEAPSHETVLVRPQWGEDDDLPRAVAVFGSWGGGGGHDYEVELTTKEARALTGALVAAADTAESE